MADDITITWENLDSYLDQIEGFEEDLIRELVVAMRDYSLLVEEGGRALAHRFGGDLEQSIVAAAVAVQNGMVVGSVGTNLSYAWIRHERPYRMGTYDLYDRGVRFMRYYLNGRGRRTHNKARWRGQMPGRKYLERAVDLTTDDFEQMMEAALVRVIQRTGGA